MITTEKTNQDKKPMFEISSDDSCDNDQVNDWVAEIAKKGGNTKWLKTFLNNGGNPNSADPKETGRSAIFFAITRRVNNLPDLIIKDLEILIAAGANLDFTDTNENTPLLVAIKDEYREISIISCLLKNGAKTDISNKQGQTPLGIAVEKGRLDIVKLLVENGANVNFSKNPNPAPFNIAVTNCHSDIVEYFLDLKDIKDKPIIPVTDPNYLLKGVVEAKNARMVELFIEKRKADVNHRYIGGLTALIIAASHGWEEGIRLLVKHKAAVTSVDDSFNTALTKAIDGNHLDSVKVLIGECKADYKGYYKGMTLSQYAKSKGYTRIEQYLNSLTESPKKKWWK